PENVLVRQDDGTLQVKLMDFGLSSVADLSRLTQSGMLVGTLAYIAPEQASGAPADGRADLYSLGILVYELVTGRVPFRGRGPQLVVAQHLGAAPIAPRRLKPEVPPALDEWILRLLAKDPAARFADADAALAALEAVASNGGDASASAAAPVERGGGLPRPLT